MTPGTYLALRRTAAGRSIQDVAMMTDTLPAIGAVARAVLIADIEADRVPISANIVRAFREVYAFDRTVLIDLVARYADPQETDGDAPQICTRCGCTWHDACSDEDGATCGWADADATLCTHCADRPAPAVPLPDLSATPDAPMPPAAPAGTAALGANLARALRFADRGRC